jgi:hypothetical protein
MKRICRDCDFEFDPDAFFDGHRRHRDVGYANQCGDCGDATEDEQPGERYVAVEEAPSGGGAKGSCEVTPMMPSRMGSAIARHVNFTQRYQRIGCAK